MSTHKNISRKVRRSVSVLAGAFIALAACSDLLDVKNPNDVTEDALDNPAAAANVVNGVLAGTARMLSGTTTPYASATDELDWTGSRDAWLQLETGAIADYFNEFTDQAFPFVGEARYVGDEAVKRLRKFDLEGTLSNRALLGQAFLYSAVVYASIADMFDDYAFSTKTDPAKPIGRAQMVTLYDKAIAYLDSANTIANSASGAQFVALRYPVMAYRARVKHARAVWQSITPKLAVGASRPLTLVNNAGANADAAAAIALGAADEQFNLANSVGSAAGINIWFEVNGRNEHRTGNTYRTLVDPVTGQLDVFVQARLAAFAAFGTQAGTFWITNTREMRLILAEAALATGNTAEVVNQINRIRALDAGRTAWNGVSPAPLAMLQYERQAQLWLMRRRLADMHRFNIKDPKWAANPNYESLFNVNGLLFPIPQVERLGNPCINEPTREGC
jgi:starch-binding outer membrane protein, SusD/RagB family